MTAPLPAHHLFLLLLQLSVLLLVALGLGRLGNRIGMPAVVGELLAGVLLGPSLLGNLAPAVTSWLFPADAARMHLLDAVGQLGLVLLVGVAGLQVDLRMVRRRYRAATAISVGGLLIPLGLGVGAGYALSDAFVSPGTDRTVFAAFLGVALCVTAIPVIAKTLSDMGMLHRNVGQLTLVAGVVDDAIGWLLLSVVSTMATAGVRLGALSVSVLCMAGFVVVACLVGRPLVGVAFRCAGRSAGAGTTVAAAVVIVLCGATAGHALGLEAVFGAFVAGVLVAATAVESLARLAPLRTVVNSVLAPIFLATAGLRMDLTALRYGDVLLGAMVVLAIAVVGKFSGAYLGARAARLSRWESVALGAGMNARGVVQMVVATVGLRLGILTTETYTMIMFVAVATTVMAPPIIRYAMARTEVSVEEELRKAEQDRAWRS